MKSGAKTPGLFLMVTGVAAFVIGLAAFAHGSVAVGVCAAIVALLAIGAGFAWLGMESRRIRDVQRQRSVGHADAHQGAE